MPLYFMHRRMPDGALQPDTTGRQIPTDTEAFTAALRLSREVQGDKTNPVPTAVEVHDAAGWLVTTVPVTMRR